MIGGFIMKVDIPRIVEDLYNSIVIIPDKKDWPNYLCGNDLVAHDLYSFYYGLQAGFELSNALREKDFIPDEE